MADDHARRHLLLATIAAHGILAHNTAVEMPNSYTGKGILELLPGYDLGELEGDLAHLTAAALLRKYNTGHNGYGNVWVEGCDTWRITPLGLITLWTR